MNESDYKALAPKDGTQNLFVYLKPGLNLDYQKQQILTKTLEEAFAKAGIEVAELLLHIKQHKRLVKGLMNSEVSDILFEHCKGYFENRVMEHLKMLNMQEKDMNLFHKWTFLNKWIISLSNEMRKEMIMNNKKEIAMNLLVIEFSHCNT